MLLELEILIKRHVYRQAIVAGIIGGALFAQSVLAMGDMVYWKVILNGVMSIVVACAAVFGIERDV